MREFSAVGVSVMLMREREWSGGGSFLLGGGIMTGYKIRLNVNNGNIDSQIYIYIYDVLAAEVLPWSERHSRER